MKEFSHLIPGESPPHYQPRNAGRKYVFHDSRGGRLVICGWINGCIGDFREDALILSRLINDERPLRRLAKKFNTYLTLSASSQNANSIYSMSSDEAREAFLIELSSYHLLLSRSATVWNAETHQVLQYQRDTEDIGVSPSPQKTGKISKSLLLRTRTECPDRTDRNSQGCSGRSPIIKASQDGI